MGWYPRLCCRCLLCLTSSLVLLLAGCSSTKPYLVSDHFDGHKFFNVVQIPRWTIRQLALHVVAGHNSGEWPANVRVANSVLVLERSRNKEELAITLVNHSTVLIQIAGINILTDPVWSERVGPFGRFGPKRVHRPGILFEQLPRIDLVLISHDHYDHLDLPTLQRLYKRDRPQILVPLGNQSFLNRKGIETAIEMDWWDERLIQDDTRIVFAPAQHTAGRWPWSQKSTLWGSFLILYGESSVYFAGDTAYQKHFQTIFERFGSIDIALLPIGGYKPRSLHQSVHMDPADAVLAHNDLGASYSIPIHHGTFQLSAEAYEEPKSALMEHLNSPDYSANEFIFTPIGTTLDFDTLYGNIIVTNPPIRPSS